MSRLTWLPTKVGVLFVTLSLIGSFGLPAPVARAATSPDLGTADSFSILSGTTVTNTGITSISGDVGISPAGGAGYVDNGAATVGGTVHDGDATAASAQTDKNTAYAALAVPACGADGGIDYGGVTHELAGETLPPGVYCATSFHLTNGTLTLNGAAGDVWIFRSASDLIITGAASQVVFTGGGLACNVWWRVVSTATIDAGVDFVGNILADTSITMAAGATLDGRALARTAEVTLDGNTIFGPTCTVPASAGGSAPYTGTITVVKTVVNDNGGTLGIADFPLFIDGVQVVSGTTNNFSFYNATEHTVTETSTSQYATAYSGDCDATGSLYLQPAQNAFCLVTNNDIGTPVVVPVVPPIINVVKVPSPLSLPGGPGLVTYGYEVTNPGTVPLTDVTISDNSCSPLTLLSGDTNGDSLLDVTETWAYHCYAELTETHTNIVVVSGMANGLTATDIANATVVVGVPVVPPLIHLTKVPHPLTLSAGGGTVEYVETITNPGTVPLSNVTLVDDKCSPMEFVSGDTNGDEMLDVTESWRYTCTSNLTATTTNTATAVGEANGFIVRDIAIATVVVASAVPSLPNTGIAPAGDAFASFAGAAAGVLLVSLLLNVMGKKRTK